MFPSRVFRHGFIFINRKAGIAAPTDLAGKRIGVQEFRQTAAVWIRGLLVEGDVYILAAWNKQGGVWGNPDYVDFFNSFQPWGD